MFAYDKAPLNEYIKNALNEESLMAGVPISETIDIYGTITNLDVDCNIGTAYWIISADFKINDKKIIKINIKKPFDGAYVGTVMLEKMRASFPSAVQELIEKLLLEIKINNA